MRGLVLCVALGLAGFLGVSCGGSDGEEKAGTGGSGADAGTSGGAGGQSGAGGTGASGTGGSGAGMCGGKPCANNTGEKEFSDPTAPSDASGLFKGATPKTDPRVGSTSTPSMEGARRQRGPERARSLRERLRPA